MHLATPTFALNLNKATNIWSANQLVVKLIGDWIVVVNLSVWLHVYLLEVKEILNFKLRILKSSLTSILLA